MRLMRFHIAYCVLLGSLCWFGSVRPAYAQAESDSLSRAARIQTERELQALEDQISQYEKRLTVARREEHTALRTLEDLNRQIKVRERLLRTYRRRNRQMEVERDSTRQNITVLQRDLQRLEEQYRGYVVHSYKHGRLKYLSLLFSSQSLNQMLVRIQYLRRFAEQREIKREQIAEKTQNLQQHERDLQRMIARNTELAQKGDNERNKLALLQNQRTQVVDDLKARRSAIEQELRQKRRDAEQLQAQLKRFIAEEAERRRALASVDPISTEEFKNLAASFSKNKGGLPWPVQGVVTEAFGTRVHPVYKTRTRNPGIEISTKPGADVRAVFDGSVTQVFVMPGYGQCIMVWHGDYTTVYSNFSSISVNQGDRIQAGQLLGYAGTDAQPKGSALFFALFNPKGKELDPKPWLKRK